MFGIEDLVAIREKMKAILNGSGNRLKRKWVNGRGAEEGKEHYLSDHFMSAFLI